MFFTNKNQCKLVNRVKFAAFAVYRDEGRELLLSDNADSLISAVGEGGEGSEKGKRRRS